MRGEGGHALMELVVSLPILAIGGAAIAGILLTSGGFLLEGERRLEVALRGSELLDSLRVAAEGTPSEGNFDALGRRVRWSWNGEGRLELHGVASGPAGDGDGGAPPWILRTHP